MPLLTSSPTSQRQMIIHKPLRDWDPDTLDLLELLRKPFGGFVEWMAEDADVVDSFVYFINDRPVALCLINPRGWRHYKQQVGGVYVHWEHRRRGIGSALLKEAAKHHQFSVLANNFEQYKFFGRNQSSQITVVDW